MIDWGGGLTGLAALGTAYLGFITYRTDRRTKVLEADRRVEDKRREEERLVREQKRNVDAEAYDRARLYDDGVIKRFEKQDEDRVKELARLQQQITALSEDFGRLARRAAEREGALTVRAEEAEVRARSAEVRAEDCERAARAAGLEIVGLKARISALER